MFLKILLLAVCSTAVLRSEIVYQCDFEERCDDFRFDSHWMVPNISSHVDHTYGNLSGHYITYMNTSVSPPLITYLTRDWVDFPDNFAACVTTYIYSGPGGIDVTFELAQGDDLQARLPASGVGMNVPDPQWRGGTIQLPYTRHFILYILLTNLTGALDLDDLSVLPCPSSEPIPPIIALFDCDFDRTVCPELISLSNYSYTWSIVQAGAAQSYTPTAPPADYSVGNKSGHYIWLNNSDSLQPGGAGYLSTPVFHFDASETTYCLSFQYYRFGLTFQTSRLTVLALADGAEEKVAQVWPIRPINYTYVDDRWSWAYASLPVGNYSLLFRMDSDYEVSSSFALDSISIHSCGYLKNYFQGASYLQFACDFDSRFDSTCGIRDDYTDLNPQSVLNYTIRSPRSIDDRELGPRQTTGWSGEQFLYLSRSDQTSATLINGQFKTPLIETNRDMCIRFAYFVNSTGVQPNENNTKINITARGCYIETLWSIELDHSFGWQLVIESFYPTACTQAIYFQITQRRPTRVAVAFDDMTIAQCGTLDVLTTTVPPSTTPFNLGASNYSNFILLITVLVLLLCRTYIFY